MGDATVYLNLYDLVIDDFVTTKVNTLTLPLGFGAFHTGVEVMGKEISFGIGEGIHYLKPHTAIGAVFRKAIVMGSTKISDPELTSILLSMESKYTCSEYDIFRRNCNHFCDDLCFILVNRHAPPWVNKLAKFAKYVVGGKGNGFNSGSTKTKMRARSKSVSLGEKGSVVNSNSDKFSSSGNLEMYDFLLNPESAPELNEPILKFRNKTHNRTRSDELEKKSIRSKGSQSPKRRSEIEHTLTKKAQDTTADPNKKKYTDSEVLDFLTNPSQNSKGPKLHLKQRPDSLKVDEEIVDFLVNPTQDAKPKLQFKPKSSTTPTDSNNNNNNKEETFDFLNNTTNNEGKGGTKLKFKPKTEDNSMDLEGKAIPPIDKTVSSKTTEVETKPIRISKKKRKKDREGKVLKRSRSFHSSPTGKDQSTTELPDGKLGSSTSPRDFQKFNEVNEHHDSPLHLSNISVHSSPVLPSLDTIERGESVADTVENQSSSISPRKEVTNEGDQPMLQKGATYKRKIDRVPALKNLKSQSVDSLLSLIEQSTPPKTQQTTSPSNKSSPLSSIALPQSIVNLVNKSPVSNNNDVHSNVHNNDNNNSPAKFSIPKSTSRQTLSLDVSPFVPASWFISKWRLQFSKKSDDISTNKSASSQSNLINIRSSLPKELQVLLGPVNNDDALSNVDLTEFLVRDHNSNTSKVEDRDSSPTLLKFKSLDRTQYSSKKNDGRVHFSENEIQSFFDKGIQFLFNLHYFEYPDIVQHNNNPPEFSDISVFFDNYSDHMDVISKLDNIMKQLKDMFPSVLKKYADINNSKIGFPPTISLSAITDVSEGSIDHELLSSTPNQDNTLKTAKSTISPIVPSPLNLSVYEYTPVSSPLNKSYSVGRSTLNSSGLSFTDLVDFVVSRSPSTKPNSVDKDKDILPTLSVTNTTPPQDSNLSNSVKTRKKLSTSSGKIFNRASQIKSARLDNRVLATELSKEGMDKNTTVVPTSPTTNLLPKNTSSPPASSTPSPSRSGSSSPAFSPQSSPIPSPKQSPPGSPRIKSTSSLPLSQNVTAKPSDTTPLSQSMKSPKRRPYRNQNSIPTVTLPTSLFSNSPPQSQRRHPPIQTPTGGSQSNPSSPITQKSRSPNNNTTNTTTLNNIDVSTNQKECSQILDEVSKQAKSKLQFLDQSLDELLKSPFTQKLNMSSSSVSSASSSSSKDKRDGLPLKVGLLMNYINSSFKDQLDNREFKQTLKAFLISCNCSENIDYWNMIEELKKNFQFSLKNNDDGSFNVDYTSFNMSDIEPTIIPLYNTYFDSNSHQQLVGINPSYIQNLDSLITKLKLNTQMESDGATEDDVVDTSILETKEDLVKKIFSILLHIQLDVTETLEQKKKEFLVSPFFDGFLDTSVEWMMSSLKIVKDDDNSSKKTISTSNDKLSKSNQNISKPVLYSTSSPLPSSSSSSSSSTFSTSSSTSSASSSASPTSSRRAPQPSEQDVHKLFSKASKGNDFLSVRDFEKIVENFILKKKNLVFIDINSVSRET
eukprot:TRINITY_DN6401_c0_g1_i6.p1 TRINITY_DN6401_c0_g1~~TRINITY_DN6401_c0_g1_i6.p1  ORF type:complete len:1510 (+),score=401.33 TRINITY_DN6401_c0_g1_i6:41-4570(+)